MKLGLSPHRIELSVWGGSGQALADCFLPEYSNRRGFCSKPRRRMRHHRRTTALTVIPHTALCRLTQSPCLLRSQKAEAELLGENGKPNFNSRLLRICSFIDLKESVISSPNFFVLHEFLIPETRKEKKTQSIFTVKLIKKIPHHFPCCFPIYGKIKLTLKWRQVPFIACFSHAWHGAGAWTHSLISHFVVMRPKSKRSKVICPRL